MKTRGNDGAPLESDPADLSRALGVHVDPEVLLLALTHRSYAYENGGIPHNERLEFLGDSVLGLAVTDVLFRAFPDLDEGELAKRRSQLVSTAALAEIAQHVDLGSYVRLGRGEALSGGREKLSILADTMEAVIGAAFVSVGIEQTSALVLRLVQPLLDDPERFGATMDPKTALQERVVARGFGMPEYDVISSGPHHRLQFHATVTVGDLVSAKGQGSSKKQAEMAAALRAWETLAHAEK